MTIATVLAWVGSLAAQTVNASQQVLLQGLRTSGGYGNFVAAASAPNGNLYLLLDEHDGLRLLESGPTGTTVLAQAHQGAQGDIGTAITVDPAGNIYVTGTTSSGALTGTGGTPFPHVADTSTNSFIAKHDANLNLLFLTFLGSGRIAAASIAATADSVFVTGITFSSTLPVTAAAIQQTPASGTTENGFVERFSADGLTLLYATYLTGLGGSTAPAAIVADANDDAYIAGATSASGFPSVAALQPRILLASGTSSSGFLAKLNPTGSAFVFSTFIAGQGISGMAFDASSGSLLLSGNVALGQFPVATVAMPLVNTSYQTLLRIPEDGQSVTESVLLTAGTSSYVTVGPAGDVWVSGAISTPLFPGITQPDYEAGDSYLLHVAAQGVIDQTLRFGGAAKSNVSYASLTTAVGAPALSGGAVWLPGTVKASVSSSLLTTQTFELPLTQSPTSLLPNTLRNVLPGASTCGTNSVCGGSGAMLAEVATTSALPALAVSSDDLPNVTVRNVGSATAKGLTVTATGYNVSSDCGSTLEPSTLCSVALSGSGPGTLTIAAGNAATETVALAATSLAPDPLAVSADELDFGIVSAAGNPAQKTLTVTNLSRQSQTFTSARDGGAAAASYQLSVVVSTCPSSGTSVTYALAAGSSCTLTLALTALTGAANDGPVATAWKIGARDVQVTGFVEAAALSVSAAEVDFGAYIAGAVRLPRYLYLSNNSSSAVNHATAILPAGSPFSVADDCPPTLAPKSVCVLQISYQPSSATETDTATLTLDDGLNVLITGEALPVPTVNAAATDPSLSVSATSLSFATAVTVTGVSSTAVPLTVTNLGTAAFALVTAITGDFSSNSGCPSTLNGGASCTLQISFEPSQPGRREGLLSVTAGAGFAPLYVALSGTGSAILPVDNGVLNLGQTLVGEPLVAWYKVQQSLPLLTVSTNSAAFGVALVQDTGTGHGALPADSFAASATIACGNCWLGVQYLSQTAQTSSATLLLTTVATGNPYLLSVSAVAQPVQGLVLTPTTADFGSVMVGSKSGPMTFALANLLGSSAPVLVQSIKATGDFTVAATTNGGAACGGLLNATASCFVDVAFLPSAEGTRIGTLTVTTNGGTATAVLSGYGTPNHGLSVAPDSLAFAAVPNAAALSQTVVLSNTGSSMLTLGGMTASNPSFAVSTNCVTLAAGAACNVVVTFTPQSATVNATLSIPVTETVNGQPISASYSLPLSGAYTAQDAGLEILPGAANYGGAADGSAGGAREFTLNNLTSKPLNVTLQMPRQFPLASFAPCVTLAANGSCTFSVSFAPAESGTLTGTVFAQGASADGLTNVQALAYMQGYSGGAGTLTISGATIPYSPLSFGQVTSGQTAQQTLTLLNSGSGPLNIRRISSAPPFRATTSCGTTMSANSNCTITVTYAPIDEVVTGAATTGTRNDTGSLTIESDAITGVTAVPMTGLVLPVASSSPASSAVLAAYSLNQSALTFANTQVGDVSAAQTLTLTNTGTTTLHVSGVLLPAEFTQSSSCSSLQPGASCQVSVTFTPTAATNASLRTGTLEIQSDATDALEYVTLIGSSTGAPLTFGQTALNFGATNAGSSTTLSVSVTNNAAAPVTFQGISASGAYSVAAGTCPSAGSTLAAGSTCTLVVTFAPTVSGVMNGTLSLASDSTQQPLTLSLTGTATAAQLQVAPGVLNFGSLAVGASGNLTMTLTNVGTATLKGVAVTLSGANATEFAVTVPCGVTQLAAGGICSETVTFTPSTAGAANASLTVASSDPKGPAVVPLSGNGVAGGTFALTVNGGSAMTLTVAAGQPADYPLLLTPLNGYAGSVALTCSAVNAGANANCSLLSPLLAVSGGGAGTTAVVSTVSAARRGSSGGLAALLLLPAMWLRRRKLRGVAQVLAIMVLGLALGVSGCGSGGGTGSGSGGGSTAAVTPAGTYQYQVTASSTSGTAISSTVTLNLVVQ